MIHLEKIVYENYRDVVKLHVSKEQENFVASNLVSLADAYITLMDEEPIFTFAIYNDDTIVGFIMIGYDDDWSAEEREDWLNSPEFKEYEGKKYYYIWRFMIGEQFQNKGYGREAFKKALEFVRTKPCGDAEYIALSYEPKNEVAKKLYASFGFEEKFIKYLHEGDEIHAILKF